MSLKWMSFEVPCWFVRFEDFMNNVPLAEYTRRDGRLNLAAR